LVPGSYKDELAKRIHSWGAGRATRVQISEIAFIREVNCIKVQNPLSKLQDMSLDLYETVVINLFTASLSSKTRILEIGTFDGNTTINLISNAKPSSEIYTVDLPDDLLEYQLTVLQGEDNDRGKTAVKCSQITSGYSKNVFLVKQDSATINFREQFGEVDLCFIDGNHSFAYVQSDTLNCFSILKPGGVIIWHDYGYIYSVTKFIDHWSKANGIEVKVVQGTRLAFAFKPQKHK
jgi:tRNA A58 N-methylase Trm61